MMSQDNTTSKQNGRMPQDAAGRRECATARRKRTAAPRSKLVQALSKKERLAVRDALNSKRFIDSAPRQVYAILLDEGTYLYSWRTWLAG